MRVIPAFNIASFDPGGTTGIATAFYPGGMEDPTLDDFNIKTDELGPDEHHSALYNFLSVRVGGPIPLKVVTESFEFRQNIDPDKARTKVELISREYIGVIKLVCQQLGFGFHQQSASSGKHFMSNEKLDLCGILVKPQHPNRHRNDALRHLIRYLVVDLHIRRPITDKWR
jgi:hypothetical protein